MNNQVALSSAYMLAFVTLVFFFLLAVLIANLIIFKPKNPGTTARRIWFWILWALTGVVGYITNYIIGSKINVPSLQSEYLLHSAIAAVISLLLFVVLGFAVSKIFSNSKVGTWF